MTEIRRGRLKGNSSRRRRSREQRERIAAILLSSGGCLLVCWLLGFIGGRSSDGGGGPAAPRDRQARLAALRKMGNDPSSPGAASSRYRPSGGRRKKMRHGLLQMGEALSDPEDDPGATVLARRILSASTHLIGIQVTDDSSVNDEGYTGIVATFCRLDFSGQKEAPPEQPMFKDVLRFSNCEEDSSSKNMVRVDLAEAVQLVREFDADAVSQAVSGPTVLDLKGVVFHESRCGSTLAANTMMALNPETNRVFSESRPPVEALIHACGEDYSDCSARAAANVLRDVIYLMGRSDDPKEENLFFKFQSVTSRTLAVFRLAFPTTPFIFLYRDPVEVMMSQLDMPRPSRANCVASKRSSPLVHKFVRETPYQMDELDDEEFCAIHLATLCDMALQNVEDADGLGMAVKYRKDLVHDFLDVVYPQHFQVAVDEAARARVLKVSGTYSKNRGQHGDKYGEFKSDSAEKKKMASPEIKDASESFLQPSFDGLENSKYNLKNMYQTS